MTPEDFIKKYASFEFQEWKKDHPGQLKILTKAMQEYSSIQISELKKQHLADLEEVKTSVQKAYVEVGLKVLPLEIENMRLKEQEIKFLLMIKDVI